jgi:poly(3-hydroxyalkanoate) synthetase
MQPLQVADKFRAFAALDATSEAALRFVQIEDWLNDGVPLAGPVARECLLGWYGENTPAQGKWRIDGAPVRPADLRLPCLALIPERDRIVPAASASALADAIPGAVRRLAPAGHIGMVVGSRAEAECWRPLADWIEGLRT